jgi:hypothetical protein
MAEGEVASLIDPEKTVVEAEVSDPPAAAALIRNTRWAGYLQQVRATGLQFQLPRNQVPELNRDLVLNNINVLSLQAKNPLEAYFLSLTASKQHVASFTD